MTPDDLRYTSTHEWVRVEDDCATVGITDHAQQAMGDITFVAPPAVDTHVKPAEECGVIESVKAASGLYAPVEGDVVEVNGELEGSPELINEDPYGRGWILKLEGVDADQLAGLMTAREYSDQVEKDA
ncbi:glycine cleavage system protein GcvH [Verrucomicrobiota bacterium]